MKEKKSFDEKLKISIVEKSELKEMLQKPQKIFIAGYTTLSDEEKKEADKLIEQLKKDGHTVTTGI